MGNGSLETVWDFEVAPPKDEWLSYKRISFGRDQSKRVSKFSKHTQIWNQTMYGRRKIAVILIYFVLKLIFFWSKWSLFCSESNHWHGNKR